MENILFSIISLILFFIIFYVLSNGTKKLYISILFSFLFSAVVYTNYVHIHKILGKPSENIPSEFFVLSVHIDEPSIINKGKIYYWVLKIENNKIINVPYSFFLEYNKQEKQKAEQIKNILKRNVPVVAKRNVVNNNNQLNTNDGISENNTLFSRIIDNIMAKLKLNHGNKIDINETLSKIEIKLPDFPVKN